MQHYTLEDIVDCLKDATHFAVFDSTKSFFHIPLDEASKKWTAMLTTIGIYIYNVLAMGYQMPLTYLKSA